MIANVTKFSGQRRAAALIAYMITAKAGNTPAHERVGYTTAHLLPISLPPSEHQVPECRSFADKVALFLHRWNRERRANKVRP